MSRSCASQRWIGGRRKGPHKGNGPGAEHNEGIGSGGSIRTGLQANLTTREAEKTACILQTGGGRR